MEVWVVRYSHRHGHDVWVEWSEPSEQDVIASLKSDGVWDETDDQDGSYVEIYGPFTKPA